MKYKPYLELCREHEGYVSHKWGHYLFIYDILLDRFIRKEKPITLLEIGVQNGGSLEIWGKYLPKGSQIHGIDIDPKCTSLAFENNIHFHLGDASNQECVNTVFQGLEFDVILDDGSHINNDVIKTFTYLFPKLKNGGIYIIEDLHTSYWGNFGGGLRRKRSSIEYFKNLIDIINADYIKDESACRKFKNLLGRAIRKAAAVTGGGVKHVWIG